MKALAVSGLDSVCCQHQASAGFPSRKESPFSLKMWICVPQNSVTLNKPIRPQFVIPWLYNYSLSVFLGGGM